MEQERTETLPQELLDYFADRSIPIKDRISRARELAKQYGEITLILERSGLADGQPFKDNQVSEQEVLDSIREYGFPDGAYEEVSRYEWRTKSASHRDLVLQVVEGSLDIGGATELFPSGQAWSQYDYVNTTNIIVAPTLPD